MKQQVWYIGGGESFLNHADFLERLKTVGLWHMDASEPGTSWTKTIEEKLGDNYEFIKIPMPNKQNAKYEEWKIWFERHISYMEKQPIIIGLSLGAMFLTKYLAENELPIVPKALFLLAGWYNLPGYDHTDAGDFLIPPAEATAVAAKYSTIIMHSKDDPVVPFAHGQALARALPKAEFVAFSDKNHFLIEEFPELINKIKAL